MTAAPIQDIHPHQLRGDYLRASARDGTLLDKLDRRTVVLPEELVVGLHNAIIEETGHAWTIIAYNCGRRWGGRLFESWQAEWERLYDIDLYQADFLLFERWLDVCFAYYGWGGIHMDFERQGEGLIDITLEDSILAELLADIDSETVCEIFSGLLASIVSSLAGEEIGCLELTCAHHDEHDSCHFVVGLEERIERARLERMRGKGVEALEAALDAE
jgi:hypothetical protein